MSRHALLFILIFTSGRDQFVSYLSLCVLGVWWVEVRLVGSVGRLRAGQFGSFFNLKMSMFFKGVSRIHESGSFRFVFNLL